MTRLVLAAASLLTAYVGTVGPAADQGGPWVPLAGYAAFAALVLAGVRVLTQRVVPAALVIHLVDTAWAGATAFLLPGRPGTSFVYLVFVVAAAAMRWGTTGALATGAFGTAALVAGAPFAALPVSIGATDLVIVTCILALIVSHQRRLRLERTLLFDTLDEVSRTSGLNDGLGAALAACTRQFGAAAGLVVLHDIARRHLFVYRSAAPGDNQPGESELTERPLDEVALLLFDVPTRARAWSVRRGSDGRGARGFAIRDQPIGGVRRFDGRPALPLMKGAGFSSVLGAEAGEPHEWRARLLLFDAAGPGAPQLRLLGSLVSVLAPVLRQKYSQHRLRSRVSAQERARLASELHDGLLQSLIGVEMQMEVLRRQTAAGAGTLEPLTRGVRDQMRQSVADARDVMQRLRPQPVTGREVLRLVAEYAERLRDEGGLEVRLLTSITDFECSPRTCGHVARIVQEALTNARKHSGARTVTVNLSQTPDSYRLIVEDDGRGLDFAGRRTLEQLEASESGPAVIKERVRRIGGRLAIDSEPGKGTRVLVEWPRRVHG